MSRKAKNKLSITTLPSGSFRLVGYINRKRIRRLSNNRDELEAMKAELEGQAVAEQEPESATVPVQADALAELALAIERLEAKVDQLLKKAEGVPSLVEEPTSGSLVARYEGALRLSNGRLPQSIIHQFAKELGIVNPGTGPWTHKEVHNAVARVVYTQAAKERAEAAAVAKAARVKAKAAAHARRIAKARTLLGLPPVSP